MIKTKYLILFWIVALIIFTFICIYRLRLFAPTPEQNKQLYMLYNNNNTKSLMNNFNNFIDVDSLSIAKQQDNGNLETQPDNVISYIDNIVKNDKIINMPSCEDVYDDDIAVRGLGYNNCKSANADYFTRNLDSKKKYGYNKSLSDLCPVSTKSDEYINCMTQLLNKFNTNAKITNKINTEMTESLNNRIQVRYNILDDIEIALNPYIYDKNQLEFVNNRTLGEPKNPTSDQISNLASNYFQSKYENSINLFTNITNNNIDIDIGKRSNSSASASANANANDRHNSIEKFVITQEIYNIDSYIETHFFGIFTPIKGQYLAFNNLTVTLTYEIVKDTKKPMQIDYSTNTKDNVDKNPNPNTNLNPNPNPYNNPQNIYKVLLTIIDNNTGVQIIYKIINIDFYLQYKNIIKLELFDYTIVNTTQLNDTLKLQRILTILGIKANSRLLISISEFTSSEHKTHTTYKLLNSDMNTIMSLEKQKK